MFFRYSDNISRSDLMLVIKGFLPRGLFLLRKRLRYKKLFPEAFITVDSDVAPQANIGRQCIIRRSTVGPAVSIGRFTTISFNSAMTGTAPIDIGSFCAIGPDTFIRSENHDATALSTFPFEHFMTNKCEEYEEYPGQPISLGSDVWIGTRSCILAGARIGHGSIIAAGSVITAGEYPPYAVLGGTPAKIIKMRFPDNVIADILADPWWEKSEEEIFTTLMPALHSPPQGV